MFEKLGKWVLILGVVVVLIVGYSLYYNVQKVNRLEAELSDVRKLAGGAVLPENVYSEITALQNQMEILERRGPDSIFVTQYRYIPSESEVRYVTEQDTLVWRQITQLNRELGYLWAAGDTVGYNELCVELDKLKYSLFHTRVEFDRIGWCSVPFIGGGLTDDADGELNIGARLGYWSRFGIGLQGEVVFPSDSTRNVELGTSAFADWRIPHLNNTAIYGAFGRNWTNKEWQISAGLHLYLN